MTCDAHCHFFSRSFFAALARQRGRDPLDTPESLCTELGWSAPESDEALSDRWVGALESGGVNRAALIGSTPGDEAAVGTAVQRHPKRLVGFFMVDPAQADAPERVEHGVAQLGLRTVCLFPAMHRVPLSDDRTLRVVEAAATHKAAVFVHCGILSVGVRKKLALPSRFDLRLGDPLAAAQLALAYPAVPFVIPHFGAGFFREALMAADTASNIYLDTSSSNSWMRYTPGLRLDTVFAAAVAVCGPSRLLFGTDSSFFPRGWQRQVYEEQKAAMKAAGISEDGMALILGGNFDRLFPSR